jgi:hypothetical protein
MLMVREVFHCKPGKVRKMVEKSLAMSKLMEQSGMGRMKIMTDYCGENYWTIVYEYDVPSMKAYEEMMEGQGQTPEQGKEFEKIMEGWSPVSASHIPSASSIPTLKSPSWMSLGITRRLANGLCRT